jgi:uncharacterized protein (TIGR03382 family)
MTAIRQFSKQLGGMAILALTAALTQPASADIVFAPAVFESDGTISVSLEVTDDPIQADALQAELTVSGPLSLIGLTPASAYEDALFPSSFDELAFFLFPNTTTLSTGTLLTWIFEPTGPAPWSAQLAAQVRVEVLGPDSRTIATDFNPSITVTAVPEPGTFAAALVGLGLLWAGARRRG